MNLRYLVMTLVTSLGPCLPPASAPPHGAPCGPPLRDIYSARALRRMRTTLELRILEARKDRLRSAYQVLEHRGSPDALLRESDDAAILAQGADVLHLKHLPPDGATTCR